MVNSNIAIGSLPTLQILQATVALFEKSYDGEPITVVTNIGEDVQYRCFNQVNDVKCVVARHYADIGKQLVYANNRNRVLGLSHSVRKG